jgi:hypothetical protein
MCVDAAIENFMAQYQSPDSGLSLAKDNPDTSESQLPITIQVLVDLHRRLDLPTGSNEPTPSPVEWKDWKAAAERTTYGNVPDSGPGQDFLTSLSDLQAWLVQLMLDSERFSI